MAVALFYTWDRLGRPLEPATPIRELVERLRVAFPEAAEEDLFSWYADDAHYENDYPQDHTPFSVTGWPEPSPLWKVFATDVMHRPDLGVDCNVLFPYWLAEAKAGRMKWLKYMIYKATVYDVRYGWKPQPSSGHDKHVHLSARTDHEFTSLGDWSITGDDMPTVEEIWSANAGSRLNPVRTIDRLNQAAADAASAAAGVVALTAVVEKLALAIAVGGGSIDTAAILAGVDERLAAFRSQVEADTRDAVADLAEGGAGAVRADT